MSPPRNGETFQRSNDSVDLPGPFYRAPTVVAIAERSVLRIWKVSSVPDMTSSSISVADPLVSLSDGSARVKASFAARSNPRHWREVRV
jgi:hypothetical protein